MTTDASTLPGREQSSISGGRGTGIIDRGSPTPLYHQLERILQADIHNGVYQPRELLPSEGEICARYEVSRSVVRQALHNLAQMGLVHTERGRGSFVAEAKLSERFVQRTTGFYEDLTRMGLDVRTRIVRQEIVPVPLEIREFLGVDTALRIDRVRSVDGRVLTYVVTYISPDRCPGLEHHDLTDRSLYAHLAEVYGLSIHSGRRTVEAVAAKQEEAAYLEVEQGTPLLLLQSAGATEDGEPLEWFSAWHRADRTRFEVEIAPGVADRPFQQAVAVREHRSSNAPTGTVEAGEHAFRERLGIERAIAEVSAPANGDGVRIARGLLAGGLSILQFSLTGADALKAIAQARTGVEGVLVGAGSVLGMDDARQAIDAGAQFIASPVRISELSPAELGVPVVLAGFTPSEVLEAHRLTQGPVTVFPAQSGGPTYLRSLVAAMPRIELIAAGGIDETDLDEYLAAGAFALVLGSSLWPVDVVLSTDEAELETRARRAREALDRTLT